MLHGTKASIPDEDQDRKRGIAQGAHRGSRTSSNTGIQSGKQAVWACEIGHCFGVIPAGLMDPSVLAP